ncbi:MAG: phospholipase A [candidate division Zixibacteria bacterium]|nr:phospholipase A [candidate division Zixibacteria bacterium]MDD5427444.1 phospholipase A [candidate division Zixibacteria bacterium]
MSIPRWIPVLASSLLLTFLAVWHSNAQQSTENFQMIRTGPGLSLHKEMFMMPVTFSDEYYGEKTEAVFQISAKHRLFNTPVYFAYTQISFWQAYDHKHSAPFRETNYNPELFYRTNRFHLYGGQVGFDIGFEHESNGQRPPVSRSWNLIYFSPYYFRSDILLYLKIRYRIPEEEKDYPEAAVGDDNPDITDYLGYSDFQLFYRFYRCHLLHLMIRGNISTGKGGVVLNYSVPIPKSEMSFFTIRISHGYGESLVDYNRSFNRIGFGVLFAR